MIHSNKSSNASQFPTVDGELPHTPSRPFIIRARRSRGPKQPRRRQTVSDTSGESECAVEDLVKTKSRTKRRRDPASDGSDLSRSSKRRKSEEVDEPLLTSPVDYREKTVEPVPDTLDDRFSVFIDVAMAVAMARSRAPSPEPKPRIQEAADKGVAEPLSCEAATVQGVSGETIVIGGRSLRGTKSRLERIGWRSGEARAVPKPKAVLRSRKAEIIGDLSSI